MDDLHSLDTTGLGKLFRMDVLAHANYPSSYHKQRARIVFINIRSLQSAKKLSLFTSMFQSLNPDFAVIVETHHRSLL